MLYAAMNQRAAAKAQELAFLRLSVSVRRDYVDLKLRFDYIAANL